MALNNDCGLTSSNTEINLQDENILTASQNYVCTQELEDCNDDSGIYYTYMFTIIHLKLVS